MRLDDTIAAISTALGPAGIGIIRVSGTRSFTWITPLFQPANTNLKLEEIPSHAMVRGWIVDAEGPLDEVLLVLMRAPYSYTTEDVVEIHCHGSVIVQQSILQLVLRQGARLADPGEFTQRAFLHGRLDLTQVEAVSDLIHAQSRIGMRVAVNQLRGKLYQAIQRVKEQVARIAALVNACIDFSEEGETFTHRDDCIYSLRDARASLEALVNSAEQGKLLRSGVGLALIGRPNVGKSSLMNALLRENRVIVTPVEGTTRDIIEESFQIEGLAIRLIDTAGIRNTNDLVESEGIQRSRQAQKKADFVFLILDCSVPLSGEDWQLIQEADREKTLLVLNKKDLLKNAEPEWRNELKDFETILVSTKNAQDIQCLEQRIFLRITQGTLNLEEHALITNLRQQQSAQQAIVAINLALEGLEQRVGEECLAVDLESCLRSLGDVVGETTADDLLNRIFSEFCIGK